jgi:hypothetical protein
VNIEFSPGGILPPLNIDSRTLPPAQYSDFLYNQQDDICHGDVTPMAQWYHRLITVISLA